MVSVVSSAMALAPLVLSMMARCTEAHTWIDCIDTDRSKIYDQSASYIFGGGSGNGFCEGYGAGYPGRGDIDIGTGYTYKMLKNEAEAGTPVCQSVGANTYSDWRKRISVAPGQTAYFAYLPNGHIVKDKKAVGTQHGVYWTGQAGTSLASSLDMKPENLLNGHTMDYDDGVCGETVDYNGSPSGRAGDGKPCVGSFVVPAGTAPGVYNMVWYWTFWLDDQTAYIDQAQAKGYFGAAYSTCFEVEVTSGGTAAAQTTGASAAQTTSTAAPVTPAPTPAPTPATPAPTPAPTPATPAPMPAPVAKIGVPTPAPAPTPATPAPTPATPAPTPATPAPTPAPVAKTGAPIVGAAVPLVGAAAPTADDSAAGTVAPEPVDGSDDDGLPTAKYGLGVVATVHPANDSSASANSSSGSVSDAGDVGQASQEEPSPPSVVVTGPASRSESGSGSRNPGSASATTMENATSSISAVERWVVLGFALVFGALL